MDLVLRGVVMGVGGALCMDAWGLLLRRRFNVPTLDYGLLGRWIGHMPRGRLVHDQIASAAPIRGERPLGYVAHYLIGAAFGLLAIGIWGPDWAREPTLLPALAVGLGTIVAPWLVMQPAMGAGIAASRSSRPGATRLRNLGTHAVYGIGVYVSAVVLAGVWPGAW